jgi:hypothetical protein
VSGGTTVYDMGADLARYKSLALAVSDEEFAAITWAAEAGVEKMRA